MTDESKKPDSGTEDDLNQQQPSDPSTAAGSEAGAQPAAANTALAVRASTALVKRTTTALTKASDHYARWHDLRTGEKDENYFSWLGWQVLIWGLGLLLIWAIFAPIEKGVSASGWVITDSNRQAIQPAFAGVIDEIYVKEGQQVIVGEVLVKLNPINAQAQANATKESISGLDAQAAGLEQAITQKKRQVGLMQKQLAGQRQLVAEGYMAANKSMELERQLLQMQGQILQDEGELTKIRKQIAEQKEKLNPFEYDLSNTALKSPVDGQVVNMQVFTKGGVVSPGQKLMEVISSNDKLIVDGQLPVHLVDKVYPGLPVEMRFTAFNTNRTPQIPGTLLSVGADRIVDEKTGNPYFKIQAETTPEGARLLQGYKVRPGMPVDLFVKTGEQTVMTYLLKPIFDRAHGAMRED